MEPITSPEMFDSPFFPLDNSMPAQSDFDPDHHGPAHNQLQVPRQAFMPFTQPAYSHSYAHPQSRQQQGSYPSSPSWQLHSRQHQHALPHYGNHYTYGIRNHAFALSHGAQARTGTAAETKARLDKKHVEILEHEFSKNQKPSSIVKRELAEQMGHEVARINNWFQNRRAKEKSNKRTAEYAAREASNQRDSSEGTSSRPRSPEHRDNGHDPHSAVGNMRRPVMSSATIGGPEPEDDDDDEEEAQHQQPYEPVPDEAADVSANDGMISHSPSGHGGLMVVVSQDVIHEETHESQQFRTPNSDVNEFDYPTLQGFHGLPQNSLNSLEYLDEDEIATAWFHPLPQAPSDYFGSDGAPLAMLNAGATMAMAEQFPSEDALKVQQLASPVSMCSTSQTPPPPKEMASRFALKSPRPINIAARRNLQRPAPLGLAISRKAPCSQGPKTGIDMPRRDTTPMRRTASATGLRRLQRVSEGLRSPGIHFQGMRSPSYNNSSGSPVSPGRSDTPATNNSDEQLGLPYSNFNAPLASRFENAINTPPVTPGLPLGYSAFANPFEQAWGHGSNEQSLATPSLCSHGGSEMDFPGTSHLPNYIASQPATPGFPRPDAFGPGFRFAHGGMSNGPEYTFPESGYVDSSPEQPMSKTFQFARNVTPQNFSSHE